MADCCLEYANASVVNAGGRVLVSGYCSLRRGPRRDNRSICANERTIALVALLAFDNGYLGVVRSDNGEGVNARESGARRGRNGNLAFRGYMEAGGRM